MDSILQKYGAKALPLEVKAKLGLLPDTLAIAQIAYLWAYDTLHTQRDGRQERLLKEALKEAVRAGDLRGEGNPEAHAAATYFDATPKWLRGYGEPIARRATALLDGSAVKISRDDFQAWLTREGEELLPMHCLLAGWWDESRFMGKEEKRRRIEQRIPRITEVIELLGYNPQAIPDKGKQRIRDECLKDTLFTKDTFLQAWKEGKRRGLWEVANIGRYR